MEVSYLLYILTNRENFLLYTIATYTSTESQSTNSYLQNKTKTHLLQSTPTYFSVVKTLLKLNTTETSPTQSLLPSSLPPARFPTPNSLPLPSLREPQGRRGFTVGRRPCTLLDGEASAPETRPVMNHNITQAGVL